MRAVVLFSGGIVSWAERIRAYCADKREVSLPDVLQNAVGKPTSQWTDGDLILVGRSLTADGCPRYVK